MNVQKLTGTAWAVWDKEKGVVIDSAKRSQRKKLFRIENRQSWYKNQIYFAYTYPLRPHGQH